MRVAVAVATADGGAISQHFGRSAGFAVFDIADNKATEIERRPNTHSHHHQIELGQHGHGEGGHHGQGECGGHGHEHGSHSHASILDALQGCSTVICRGMGQRAIVDLAANGITPLIITGDVTAQQAADLYAQGKLGGTNQSSCGSH
jgi:predicted Fe-Mo cluster-binding NifX family protein